ncbi:BN159_2729 family protein [Streptomyces phaeofaciens]|uniref:BN159_2729 family protein n=1 Tax=Streptomyces phaeofaciens TaxID=68254 RepID=UPI003673E1A5
MNSNLPHAAGVIRAVLESVRPEQATVVAHALDSARLLVDPERSFGAVLHRTPDGGWARDLRPVTDLERQALAWDASCERARCVARAIERHLAGHAGPYGIRVDGDRVRVVLRVDDAAEWDRWRAYFGITAVGERIRPHTVTAEGERGGVRVSVVARGRAQAPPATARAAVRPFRLGGTTYDLALPQCDAHGDVWYFQGFRTRDGMPLMSLDGRPERCSLANVAAHLGPLTPVRPVTPVPVAGPVPVAAPVPPPLLVPTPEPEPEPEPVPAQLPAPEPAHSPAPFPASDGGGADDPQPGPPDPPPAPAPGPAGPSR